MLPPFDAAQSRHTRATFLAAVSEIWLLSKTFIAAFALRTKSAGRVDLGGAAGTNLGAGPFRGSGFCRGGRSCTSGGTDGPMTSVNALCAQISSLQIGT